MVTAINDNFLLDKVAHKQESLYSILRPMGYITTNIYFFCKKIKTCSYMMCNLVCTTCRFVRTKVNFCTTLLLSNISSI